MREVGERSEKMNSLDGIYKRQLLNEEYKIWKKNAPFMYDLVITHILEWTSLSVEWLPIFEVAEDPDLRIHNLVLGTDCPEGEKNHLLIVKVSFESFFVDFWSLIPRSKFPRRTLWSTSTHTPTATI